MYYILHQFKLWFKSIIEKQFSNKTKETTHLMPNGMDISEDYINLHSSCNIKFHWLNYSIQPI